MRFSNSNYDSDYIRKIRNEFESGQTKKKNVVVKIPCHGVSVEITEPRDQILVCPVCYGRSLFTYVPVTGKSRIWEERK